MVKSRVSIVFRVVVSSDHKFIFPTNKPRRRVESRNSVKMTFFYRVYLSSII